MMKWLKKISGQEAFENKLNEFTNVGTKELSFVKEDLQKLRDLTDTLNEKDELIYAAKEEWEETFKNIPDGIVIFNIAGAVERFNESAKEIYPCIKEGSYFPEIFKEILPDFKESTIYKSFITYKTISREYYHPLNGRYYIITSTPIFDENSGMKKIVHISRDVTEISKLKNRLFNVLSASDSGFWDWDISKGTYYFSNKFYEILGYEKDEFHFDKISDFWTVIHQDDEIRLLKFIKDFYKKVDLSSREIELRIKCKNGNYKWILCRGSIVDYKIVDDTESYRICGIIIDIDEKKRNSEELIAKEQQFRELSNVSPVMIVVHSGDIVLYSNQSWCDFFGNKPDDVSGICKIEKLPKILEMKTLEMILDLDQVQQFEIQLENIKKENIWFQVYSKKFRYNKKDAILSVLLDINKKVINEKLLSDNYKKLKDKEKFLEQITDTMTDLLWAKDLNKKYIFANKIAKDVLFNPNKDDINVIGMNDIQLAEIQRKIGKKLKIDSYHTFGEICVDSDSITLKNLKSEKFFEDGNVQGKYLALDVAKAPLYDSNGELIGIIGCGRDVTEEIKIKNELEYKNKILEAVVESSRLLAEYDDWDDSIEKVLKIFGSIFDSDRTYIYQNEYYKNGDIFCRLSNEWVSKKQIHKRSDSDSECMCYKSSGLRLWKDLLENKECVCGNLVDFTIEEKDFLLEPFDIKSICVIPIFVRNKWWGFIGFDLCGKEKDWTSEEKKILNTLSEILGGYVFQRELFQKSRRTCSNNQTVDYIREEVLKLE